MSNDTQVAAHTALAKECGAITYTHRSNPHEAAVSFGPMAWEKFVEASARQLSEQPGFVMVPVGDMAELREALDICVSLLESAKSNHLPRIIAAYTKAEAIVKAENCDCPAKDMPFGRCCKARPLTASPTAPSTEASEPVATIRYERGTPGKENDMPKVVSCNWLPDGVYSVYTTPPPAPVLSDAWISVDERLPGDQGCDSEEVMLFINGHCEITDMECRQGGAWGLRLGYFDAEKQAFRVHGRPESFVTHWMPLPPPPIEQAIGRASKGAK